MLNLNQLLHCDVVILHFTRSLSHGTSIFYLPTLFGTHTHTCTHSHTPMGLLCVCDQQGSTSGFNNRGYKLFRYADTLIYSFTDGNTVFMTHCCSDTWYGLNIFLVPTLQRLGGKMVPLGADGAEHYSNLSEMLEVKRCTTAAFSFLQCTTGLISCEHLLHCSIRGMCHNISCLVRYSK